MYVYKEVLLQQLSSFSYPYHPMIPLLDYWNIFFLCVFNQQTQSLGYHKISHKQLYTCIDA